jgi:hypothetical protein
MAGETHTALRHYHELLATTSVADAGNPRLEKAKVFLTGHPGS